MKNTHANRKEGILGNDICRSCSEEFGNATTADLYALHIEDAIQRIQGEVSNVIINLSKLGGKK